MALAPLFFDNHSFGFADCVHIGGIGFSHHQDFTVYEAVRLLGGAGQMHLATHRTRADADPASEHRRDDAHFDEIGGAADPFQGTGGFDHQIALPQQAFLLGHPHGQGKGAGGGALFGD